MSLPVAGSTILLVAAVVSDGRQAVNDSDQVLVFQRGGDHVGPTF